MLIAGALMILSVPIIAQAEQFTLWLSAKALYLLGITLMMTGR